MSYSSYNSLLLKCDLEVVSTQGIRLKSIECLVLKLFPDHTLAVKSYNCYKTTTSDARPKPPGVSSAKGKKFSQKNVSRLSRLYDSRLKKFTDFEIKIKSERRSLTDHILESLSMQSKSIIESHPVFLLIFTRAARSLLISRKLTKSLMLWFPVKVRTYFNIFFWPHILTYFKKDMHC